MVVLLYSLILQKEIMGTGIAFLVANTWVMLVLLYFMWKEVYSQNLIISHDWDHEL